VTNQQLAEQSLADLSIADQQAHEAEMAYASGNLQGYWDRLAEKLRKRMEEEYDEFKSDTDGGDPGPSGGVGPN
jgi:hypothetical protein